jgi:hypothetical protein
MKSMPASSRVRRTLGGKLLSSLTIAQSHTRAAAILVDELDLATLDSRIGVVQKTWLKRLDERFVSERNVQPKDVCRGRARGMQSQPRAATRPS